MISVNQALVQFGGFTLFKDVSFVINKRDKIGLVGKNGAGKSTLLKIIAQKQSLSAGQLNLPKDSIIGYLPQQMKLNDSTSVFKETLSVFSEILEIEKKIEKINNQLAERQDYESDEYTKLIDDLTEFNEKFHISGGNVINEEVERILIGLGFLSTDFERNTKEFSGGWRMRIELAKILLNKPDVLLLDEPTNHLDIVSIEWLEELLKDYKGAVMLVSHDRRFLDNVTHRTIEISAGKAYDYKVSYTKYVQLRAERREQQMAAYKNQQKLIQDAEKFIERFRYKATKAVQVQSRIKQLNKLERIEIDEEDYSNLHFKFATPPRSGNLVLEIKQLSKTYDNLLVLDKIDLIIERGEKISFVGRNGEGKTTLSRVIIGQLAYTGNLKVGHNVKIGYYAQNQAELLNESKTVFETIDHIAVGDIRTKIRNILGTFLFKGEDADKKVQVLSGGERARLALACLLLEPFNLLILDEPTNHLDIRSKDVLKQALLDYTGTIIIVSHDRDFLNGLTDKVYEFKNKKLKEHLGGINSFLRKNKIENLHELNRKKSLNKQLKETFNNKKNKSYKERKNYDKKIKKLSNLVSSSESKISELESKIALLNNAFNTTNSTNELKDEKKFIEYQNLQDELENEMENWSTLQEKLENLKNQYSSL